jgi:hypothetical protein
MLGIFIYIPYLVLTSPQSEISEEERRDLAMFEPIAVEEWMNQSFQSNFDLAFQDQFPNRNTIIFTFKKGIFNIQSWIKYNSDFVYYVFHPVLSIFDFWELYGEYDKIPGYSDEKDLIVEEENILSWYERKIHPQTVFHNLISLGTDGVFQVENTQYLMNKPIPYDEEYINNTLNRVEEINQFATYFPGVDFYVYKPTQVHEREWFVSNDNEEFIGEDLEMLMYENYNLPFKASDIRNMDEYYLKYYRADHHWNHIGAYAAYRDVLELMNITDEPMIPIDENCFDDLEFYGTFGSRTGFVTEPSPFCMYEFDLPVYEYAIDGQNVIEYNHRGDYSQGNITRDPFMYHYNEVYGYDDFAKLAIINTEKENGKLLIIGDSYFRSVLPNISSHFKYTYFYDIRKLYTTSDFGTVNLNKFINENGIEKVIYAYSIEYYFLPDTYNSASLFRLAEELHYNEDINE